MSYLEYKELKLSVLKDQAHLLNMKRKMAMIGFTLEQIESNLESEEAPLKRKLNLLKQYESVYTASTANETEFLKIELETAICRKSSIQE